MISVNGLLSQQGILGLLRYMGSVKAISRLFMMLQGEQQNNLKKKTKNNAVFHHCNINSMSALCLINNHWARKFISLAFGIFDWTFT